MTQISGKANARWIAGIAATSLAFAGATIALASDGDTPTAEPRETVIVKVVSGDAPASGQDAADKTDDIKQCGGARPQVDTSDESRDKDGKIRRARVVICNRLGDSQADILEALEKARTRLAGISELSEAAKAKALASLDEEIARMKASPGYSRQ